jgi:hypothetical protein
VSRGASNDTNKTSDSQKPRKVSKSKKNVELAMKYKMNADEMRRKRSGIENQTAICNINETNYSSAMSSHKNINDESRETPNFSLAISRKDLKNEWSPESPPKPA